MLRVKSNESASLYPLLQTINFQKCPTKRFRNFLGGKKINTISQRLKENKFNRRSSSPSDERQAQGKEIITSHSRKKR